MEFLVYLSIYPQTDVIMVLSTWYKSFVTLWLETERNIVHVDVLIHKQL